MKKVDRGYLYKTDGTTVKVQPINGKKFDYHELQKAVGGYIESLIAGNHRCKRMYCNEEGLLENLPPNPHTWEVVNAKVYDLNGYTPDWRVSGNIIAVLLEEPNGETLPTIAEAMGN